MVRDARALARLARDAVAVRVEAKVVGPYDPDWPGVGADRVGPGWGGALGSVNHHWS